MENNWGVGNNVHIVNGLGSILNKENMDPEINSKELERSFRAQETGAKYDARNLDSFNDELNSLANSFGFKMNDDAAAGNETASEGASLLQPRGLRTEQGTSSVNVSDYSSGQESLAFNRTSHFEPDVARSDFVRSDFTEQDSDGTEFAKSADIRTNEQERRNHINQIMGDSADESMSFEKDKQDDLRCEMLADIDSLISALKSDGIDISRIPEVNTESDTRRIEIVLRILRKKNDHMRLCSFADEFLLLGAQGMEDIFDGKRVWFGKYRPDLTGWHTVVGMKLRRMKHDTGQIVSNLMQDWSIGPGARLLLELVPSMILYSRHRTSQYGQTGVFTDEEAAQANNNIRNIGNV
jgi:hypothetical protein